MSTELIKPEITNPAEVFTLVGIEPVIAQVRALAMDHKPDLTSKKGREEIASIAFKVSKSKTYLDGLGADLVEEWKSKSKIVDQARKRMRDELDRVRDEVRAPLTEWENREKVRVEKLELRLKEIDGIRSRVPGLKSFELRGDLEAVEAIIIDDSWEEFKAKAQAAKDETIAGLLKAIEETEKYEAEQLELKKLREEKEAREKKEREEQIAKEAAERATREAEERAEAQRKKDADDKARLEKEKVEAEQRAKKAEQDAKDEAVRAEARQKEAVEKARKEEQDRQEREKQAEEAARAKREANQKHLAKINNEVLAALVTVSGVTEDSGKAIIKAIVKGKIPHTKIQY